MMTETALIVGMGEVGTALAEVLGTVHDLVLVDLAPPPEHKELIDVMHVCFPYSDDFIDEVKRYKRLFSPKWTVIHSTVEPGASEICGASHSPVMGVHPHLAESLRMFTKFIGGPRAGEVADHFRAAGMRVYLFDRQDTTEMMKILSTNFYAVCIEFTKEVKTWCDIVGIPFEAWTLWTQAYNEGYQALGRPEYTRPNLIPIMKEIGGHCVLQNCRFFEDDFIKLVESRNRKDGK